MCAKSDDSLDTWLKRHQDYTSRLIQNEIMSIMSNDIIREICSDLQKAEPTQPGIFSVVVDSIRDVTGKEQESICVRYVTDDLFPAEAFLGFYEAESTTGESLRRICLMYCAAFSCLLKNFVVRPLTGPHICLVHITAHKL